MRGVDEMDQRQPGRRQYSPPTLIVYGEATRLTQSATGEKNDKGSGSKTRTA
jgi:hypothetical protein